MGLKTGCFRECPHVFTAENIISLEYATFLWSKMTARKQSCSNCSLSARILSEAMESDECRNVVKDNHDNLDCEWLRIESFRCRVWRAKVWSAKALVLLWHKWPWPQHAHSGTPCSRCACACTIVVKYDSVWSHGPPNGPNANFRA